MENWQCPVEYLDEDIRDVVRVIYENGMKPYMSCSGSYKDHKGKSAIPQSACVEMLDSELARQLMASIISDKRFKCSISKKKRCMFYDNELPDGFRFKIEFENICGDVSKDLLSVLQEIVKGMNPNVEDRSKIDAVCELIDTFDVSKGNSITFSFNDEWINPTRIEEDNYSITISDEKDFAGLKIDFGKSLGGFIQNDGECRFLGNDYITMLTFLRKIGIEYPQIPRLKPGQKLRRIVDESRIDKFMFLYSEKVEVAKFELETKQEKSLFVSQPVGDLEDLLGFFQGENDDDGLR